MSSTGNSNKNIVFINQATGYLTIDIVNTFAQSFDNVALIAGSIRVQDIPLNPTVRWEKIVRYNRGNPGRKFFSWLIGSIQIFFLLLFRYRRYEVFYFTVPPFAYLLSLIFPNKFSILVFDVYPDVLKIYGISPKRLLYRAWKRWNLRLFRRAHRIFTIGEKMAGLVQQYVSGERVTIVPLWTGLTKASPVPKRNNEWLKGLNLCDRFIVEYSGNIGYTHNVEVVVEIAERMKNYAWCQFLIVGRGDKAIKIKELIDKKELTNCTLLPFQPDNMLTLSLAAADIGVVLLDEKVADVSLPSKIYNLQAVGVPILGISPPESELADHLKKYGNGVCFRQHDLDGITNFINRVYSDSLLRRQLSENSLKAAEDFTMANAYRYLDEYL